MQDAYQVLRVWLASCGLPALFAGVLLENAGVPVPGETAVLLAAFLASQPDSPFSLAGVVTVTVAAAVLGDNLGFWLGCRWARPRLQQGKRILWLTPRRLQGIEGYFQRHGTWTVFIARFVTGLRVVGALVAGTVGMAWPRFLVANAAGAVVWAITMCLLGYFFGQSWQLLRAWLGHGELVLLGCAIVIVGLAYIRRRLSQRTQAQQNPEQIG